MIEQMTLELERDTPSPERLGSPSFFAYYGNQHDRTWGRVGFFSEDALRMAVWNDGALYGEHRANEETCLSRLWQENTQGQPRRDAQKENS